jgi:hypothetical protein
MHDTRRVSAILEKRLFYGAFSARQPRDDRPEGEAVWGCSKRRPLMRIDTLGNVWRSLVRRNSPTTCCPRHAATGGLPQRGVSNETREVEASIPIDQVDAADHFSTDGRVRSELAYEAKTSMVGVVPVQATLIV